MFSRFNKEKSGTVLYCAAIQSVMYPLLMHKIGINFNKDAVLLIDKNEFGRKVGDLDSIHRFKEQGIFSDVIDYDIFSVRKEAEENPKNHYIEYFDRMFHQCGYQIEKFDEIYVLNDSWDNDINLYFNFKGIEYTWINLLKNYIPVPSTNLKWRNELMNVYKEQTPFAKYAKPCILDDSDQIAINLEKIGKDYSTWDLDNIYRNLSEKEIERICKCFRFNIPKDAGESVLLIKNSGWWYDNNAFKGWEDRESYIRYLSGSKSYFRDDFTPIFDKIALDFYAPKSKKIFIKEHPSCPLNRIQEELYGEKVETFPKIPFEILIKYFNQQGVQFDTIIGYLSTSLSALDSSICNHLFTLGENFFRTCFFYNSLYTVLRYASYCKLKWIYCNDTIRSQLEFLLQTMNFSIELRKYDPYKSSGIKDALFVLDYVLEGRDARKDFLEHIQNSSAVCFLNVELTDTFFEDDLMENIVPIEIKKEKISEGFMNLQRTERLWIYSKNNLILKSVRFFTMEKIMPRCGLRVYVEESNLADGVELFQTLSQRRKLKILSTQVDKLMKVIEKAGDDKFLTGMLQIETDVCQYVQILNKVKGKYLVILSVRDTPGDYLPTEAVQALHEFGFTKFTKELWRMYIGISSQGQIICDILGSKRESPINYSCSNLLPETIISVSSMAWRQGNKAQIIINDTDYSVNIRGINIVVYDTQNKKLIDSVGFDYHDIKKRSLRN